MVTSYQTYTNLWSPEYLKRSFDRIRKDPIHGFFGSLFSILTNDRRLSEILF